MGYSPWGRKESDITECLSTVYIYVCVRVCVCVCVCLHINIYMSFPGGSDSKESACNSGDLGSIPGARSSRVGNGNPLLYGLP